MNNPWMATLIAGILFVTPAQAAVNPTPDQMALLHRVMDEERKELEPLMAREKELLKIRNALVQAKIKAIPGKKTQEKARAVLKDPEVQAANTEITTLRKTMIERRKSYEARKKDIFVKH